MPILLKTPFQPGGLDKNDKAGYPMCQLVGLYHNALSMAVTLQYEYGTATGDHYENWQRGAIPTQSVDLPGEEVAKLWSTQPKDGETVGQAMRRLTYQYLIDKGYADGEVADVPPLVASTDANASVEPASKD